MFRKQITVCFVAIACFILFAFIFFAYSLKMGTLYRVNDTISTDVEEKTNEETIIDVDVEVVDISNIDLKKGAYTLVTYVELQYNPEELKKAPEFMVMDAEVVDKRLLKHEINYDGCVTEVYYVRTNHEFVSDVAYYPLDWQVLTFDMVSKNAYDTYSFKIRSFSISDKAELDSYTLQDIGITERTAIIEIGTEELFTTYMSRGYLVLEHSSFLFYLRSFQMMLVSVILALISFLSISDNARFGSIIGALLISMGNITSLLSKVRDDQSMTLLDVSSLYYILVIVGVLIIVSINSRKRYNLDKIEKCLQKTEDTEPTQEEKENLRSEKKKLEILIKKLDVCAIIALNVMIWGYFFGVYLLLFL